MSHRSCKQLQRNNQDKLNQYKEWVIGTGYLMLVSSSRQIKDYSLHACTIFKNGVLYKMEVWTFLDLKLYRHFEMPIAVAWKSTLSASNPLGDATHPVYAQCNVSLSLSFQRILHRYISKRSLTRSPLKELRYLEGPLLQLEVKLINNPC